MQMLQSTTKSALQKIHRLVFLMEANRVLCEVRSESSLLSELTVVFKCLM